MTRRATQWLRRAAVAAMLLAGPGGALACQCPWASRAIAAHETSYIFRGRVLDVAERGGESIASVRVLSRVKGDVPAELEISTSLAPMNCGYLFRRGETLMIGVERADGVFYSGIGCAIRWLNPKLRR